MESTYKANALLQSHPTRALPQLYACYSCRQPSKLECVTPWLDHFDSKNNNTNSYPYESDLLFYYLENVWLLNQLLGGLVSVVECTT